MSGEAPEPSKPYQGPLFGLQDNALSNFTLGSLIGQQQLNAAGPQSVWNVGAGYTNPYNSGYLLSQNPYPAPSTQPAIGSVRRSDASVGFTSQSPTQSTPTSFATPMGGGRIIPLRAMQPQIQPQQPSLQDVRPVYQTGFQFAGQNIPGQMAPNTSVGAPAFRFYNPGLDFTQRTPYQFQNTPQISVADTYRPSYDLARRDIQEQGNLQQEQILNDLNARGMLTSGAANRAVMLQQQEQGRKMADLASQYSIEQGKAQLQEDQLRRQMEADRQQRQAEEIFRQQGATDQQAKDWAAQSINLQNLQASQNVSAGDQLLRQQGQQFTQALQGRQQGTAEEQLANLIRRQPVEDLMKMWQVQAGPTGSTPGDSGLMPILGKLGGALIGALI